MKKYGFAFLVFAIALTLILVACNPAKGIDGIDGKDGINGKDGKDGHSPVVSIVDGYWTIDGADTRVKAVGENGATPTISISEDGYWVIDGQVSEIPAIGHDGKDGNDGLSAYQVAVNNGYEGTEQEWLASLRGQDGANGQDGATPTLTIDFNGYWVINGIPTQTIAEGTNGHSPIVAIENGYWTIDGVNTGVVAEGTNGMSAYQIAVNYGYEGTEQEWLASLHGQDGENGQDGTTPTIAINQGGYWVINGQVSDIIARGSNGTDGANGHSPVIAISGGYWTIDGVGTGVVAEGTNGTNGISAYQVAVKNGYTGSEQQWLQSLHGQDGSNGTDGENGENGENGMSIYELYVQIYGYEGTEQEWLDDVLNGTLGVYTTHTIDLDYNGYANGTPTSLTVVDGRTATLPSPVREGYDFLGWYTGEGVNDGQWTNTLLVCNDMELIARWQQQTVNVRYEDKDGVLLSEQTVAYGEDSIAPAAPNVASYVFSHWDGATTAHKADVTLRPVYVAQRYTVTYDTDGGNEIAAASYLFTETPAKPLNPQKSGWVFDVWVIGDTDEVYSFDAPFAEDTTLRARWSDTVKIYTASDLVAIGDNLTSNYTLANNIDLDGAEWTPLGAFSGVLDGDGHKIVNFRMTVANSNLAFVQTNNGTIRNITFEDVLVNQTSVSSNTAVVACANNGTLDTVHVKDATVSYSTSSKTNNDKIGGLAATNGTNGNILHCSIEEQLTINHNWTNSSSKTEYLYAGGAVATNSGMLADAVVTLNATSKIIAKSNADGYHIYINYSLGGLCGVNHFEGTVVSAHSNTFISHSSNTILEGRGSTAYPWGYTYSYSYVGGAIGINEGNASKLLTTGTMTCNATGTSSGYGNQYWGGAIGRLEAGTAKTLYSDVSIIGTNANVNGNVGGVIGYTDNSTSASNIWYDGNVVGTKLKDCGGICGYNQGTITNVYCTGKMTSSGCTRSGLVVGGNTTSGYIGKYIIAKKDFSGNGIGNNEGTANKCYIVTDENKEAIYNEDFLYGENILSSNVWGVCEGLSVYLKAFADHEHDYGDTPETEDRYCTIPGCGYAVKGVEEE